MTTPSLIPQALAVLRARGHATGAYFDDNGRVCSVGALLAARRAASQANGVNLDLDFDLDLDLDLLDAVDDVSSDVERLASVISEQYPDWLTRIIRELELVPAAVTDFFVVAYFNDTHRQPDVERVFEKAQAQL